MNTTTKTIGARQYLGTTDIGAVQVPRTSMVSAPSLRRLQNRFPHESRRRNRRRRMVAISS